MGEIQAQIIALSKALSFYYILGHHPRDYKKNRSIPIHLFSSNVFKSGWDGKTLQIKEGIKRKTLKKRLVEKVDDTKEDKAKDDENKLDIDNEDKTKEIELKKKISSKPKIYEIDKDDQTKTVARNLYTSSNQYALSLWSSVSHNLMIPKSLQPIIDKLRLPVLSALIRHLPLKQQKFFVEEHFNKSDEVMNLIKSIYLSANNILRWVLNQLMTEKKSFNQIENIYQLYLEKEILKKQEDEINDRKKAWTMKQRESEQKQPEFDQKENKEPDDTLNNDS